METFLIVFCAFIACGVTVAIAEKVWLRLKVFLFGIQVIPVCEFDEAMSSACKMCIPLDEDVYQAQGKGIPLTPEQKARYAAHLQDMCGIAIQMYLDVL